MARDLLIDTYVKIWDIFFFNDFTSDDIGERLGFRRGYVTNLVSELMRHGYLSSRTDEKDRRRRLYRLELRVLDEVLSSELSPERKDLETLRLFKSYLGEYIAIVDKKVVDHDEDLQALAKRIIGKYPLGALYVTCVGTPRRTSILEF